MKESGIVSQEWGNVQLALKQGKGQVMHHFAGNEKQLSAAMNRLSSMKAKYKGYEGTLNVLKKPGNPMKEKSFFERLVPRFNVQIQSKKDVTVDFNPEVGYRLGAKVTLGIGWNERLGFNGKKKSFNYEDHIFGPRIYGQFKIKQGVYALGAPEVMNAWVPPPFNINDPLSKKWVFSWMGGLKKEFRYYLDIQSGCLVIFRFYTIFMTITIKARMFRGQMFGWGLKCRGLRQ